MAQPELIKDIEARVKKSGDIMTGLLSAHGGISLNASTKQETPEYILGIKSFANGGNIIWQSISSVQVGKANALTVSAGSSTTPVYFSGGQPVACSYSLGANIYAYSGSLASGGWKTMHGKADSPVISIAYNNGATAWNSGTYSSSMVFGCQDTRGLLDLAYNQPIVTFGGTAYGNATDDNPAWYFKLSGASGQTYTFPTSSKTLCATDGSNASGTWGISISGNASTATAVKDRQTGTAIYLNYGASSLTSASLLAAWNGYELRTISPKAVQDLVQHSRQVTVDLSSLDNSKWFPVTGSDLPRFGYNKIKVSVQLNSGTTPSWSTHAAGFTVNVELYTTQSGWGTTGSETIVLNDSYSFATVHPVGYSQNSYSSTPILWLRGGGKYYVETDFEVTWTVRTSLYYTYNSPPYTQTVEPTTSYPGIQGVNGTIKAGAVYGAVWNDYAEYRKAESIEPGRVVVESADGEMKLSTERLQPGAEIISDTFGFAIGETDEYKTPIAATGRVLAYPNEDRYSYPLGCAVCSGPNGTVSQMTREEIREYPERIIGTVSEIPEYKTWGTGNVEVNGRIWIRIK